MAADKIPAELLDRRGAQGGAGDGKALAGQKVSSRVVWLVDQLRARLRRCSATAAASDAAMAADGGDWGGACKERGCARSLAPSRTLLAAAACLRQHQQTALCLNLCFMHKPGIPAIKKKCEIMHPT